MPAPVPAHRRLRLRALALLACAAVIAAACGDSTSSPAASAGPSAGPGGTADPATSAGPSTAPGSSSGAAGEATSASKIQAAVDAGALDEPTALLDRTYAAWGDERLPAEYAGAPSDDEEALYVASTLIDTFPAEIQAELRPFLERPTSPTSWFAASPATGATARLAAAHPLLETAALCSNGFARLDMGPAIPVVVWAQCGGASESEVLADGELVVSAIQDVWGPMTALMGLPIPDDATGEPGATPEASDGLLDVYLVDAGVRAHGRKVEPSAGALAVAPPAEPFGGSVGSRTASGYLVVDGTRSSATELASTVAHELWHVLGFAHNYEGLSMSDSAGNSTFSWWVEASAVWAEHAFVPASRSSEVYPRWEQFVVTDQRLSSTRDDNEYDSFAWPLFMEQEAGRKSIGSAWRAMEGVSGGDAVLAAIDRQLAFADSFGRFALRVYNVDLDPGHPINPLFRDLDPAFPEDIPTSNRGFGTFVVSANGEADAYITPLKPLYSHYTYLTMDADVGQVRFDFSGFDEYPRSDVQLLLQIRDKGWVLRQGTEEALCDVEQAVVVTSDADHLHPTVYPDVRWTVTGLEDECAGGTWSMTLKGAYHDAGAHAGTGEILCMKDSRGYSFTATVDPDDPAIWFFGASEDLKGSISVTTHNEPEPPEKPTDWEIFGNSPGRDASVKFTADESADPVTMVAEGSWIEFKQRVAIRIEVACTDFFAN